MSPKALPLAGLRILSVEQYGAGPFATMHLADLGADVVKIEPTAGEGEPAGDTARHVGGHGLGECDSQFFQTFNRNKRSVTLDIRAREGRAAFLRLVAGADAVLNNLRGDLPARLGLDFASLKPANPRIVCVHLSGYGRTGPRAAYPAYDYLAQAEAGWTSLTGEPEGPPVRAGLSVVDFLAGLTAATGLLAAVIGARASGDGRDVDVNLYDVALHSITYPATWALNSGTVTARRPRGGHPSIVPCEMFPTSDGHVFVMCVKAGFWRKLAAALGRPHLPEDPRFSTFAARLANRDALVAVLDPLLAARPTAHWMAELGGKVPIAPVLTLAEALANPFLADREALASIPHPADPDLRVVANPIRLDGARLPARCGPGLGADVDAVLAEAGFSADEIARLKAAGVV